MKPKIQYVASTIIAFLIAWAGLQKSAFLMLPNRSFTSADPMFRLAKIHSVFFHWQSYGHFIGIQHCITIGRRFYGSQLATQQ